MLIEEEATGALSEIFEKKLSEEYILEHSENPEDYDPEYPFDGVDDYEEFYRPYIYEKYPELEIYTYGHRYGVVDGYSVFISDTLQFAGVAGEAKTIEPSAEGLKQLEEFKQEFSLTGNSSLKQWSQVC